MSETITERDEADAMFDSFDAENTDSEEVVGFTNILIAENAHYKELSEWFDNMSISEFALWKLCKLIHSY